METSKKSNLPVIGLLVLLLLLVVGGYYVSQSGSEQVQVDTPEAVVLAYFAAMQKGDFASAYSYLSPTMKDGRSQEQFVEEWKNIAKLGQVRLYEFGIESIEVEADKAKAIAWTRSSDVFNKDGIVEREIDRLVRIDGNWLIEDTELIIDE